MEYGRIDGVSEIDHQHCEAPVPYLLPCEFAYKLFEEQGAVICEGEEEGDPR